MRRQRWVITVGGTLAALLVFLVLVSGLFRLLMTMLGF